MTRSAHPPNTMPGDGPEAAHRLDWRFLLANPRLDRLAYIGRRHGGALASLKRLSHSVDVLDSDGHVGCPDHLSPAYELVVACDPSRAELLLAAGCVEPGGTLLVEASAVFARQSNGLRVMRDPPWPGRNLWLPGQLAREVSKLGFDVRSYWHWPSFDHCTQIIPLDEPLAVRCAFSRVGRGIGHQARALAGRVLLRMDLLRWAIGCMSIVGRRAKGELAGRRAGAGPRAGAHEAPVLTQSTVHAFLSERWERLGLDRRLGSRRFSYLVLTPRFRSSGNLVFLLLPEGESEPVLVAKVPRLPGHFRQIEREAQLLRDIQASRPGGFESIPSVVAYEACLGHMILLETAVRGRALDPVTVRKAPRRSCEAMLAWLIEIQRATRHAPASADGWFERLIGRQLSELETVFPAEGKLIARTRDLILPLSTMNLALVLEHGDLSHPNLLVDSGGRVGVLDWELGETQGLPAADLFFFLTYVARARAGAQSSAESIAAVDKAFLGRRSWSRAYVRSYAQAMALSQDTLTPLFIACWARQVFGLVRRMDDGGQGPWRSSRSAIDCVQQDWRLAVWRHAVERADRLCWHDPPS